MVIVNADGTTTTREEHELDTEKILYKDPSKDSDKYRSGFTQGCKDLISGKGSGQFAHQNGNADLMIMN